ncbi:MAG: hypothetical protein GKS06_01015 [Acidobacteria bacterium]|nr:hypothetical protein [Acidobacteriota bacterium]
MDEELTPDERAALRELGNAELPGGLEGRVVGALRESGEISTPAAVAARPGRWIAAAAAAVMLFVGGMTVQRLLLDDAAVAVASAAGDRYLLLLLEPADVVLDAAIEMERVAEYGAWAGGLAQRGLLEAGEKLADGGDVVGAAMTGPPPGERVTGFFIVRAESAPEARALAEASPHVRHGGRVEVRLIEPT